MKTLKLLVITISMVFATALCISDYASADATWSKTLDINYNASGVNKPFSPLAIYGNTLYGVTHSSNGVAYKVGTDGTGMTWLYNVGGAYGTNIVVSNDGSKLFGTKGNAIYSIDSSNGSGYAELKTYSGNEQASNDFLTLSPDGNWLYGYDKFWDEVNQQNIGRVFKVGTSSMEYIPLKSFSSANYDYNNVLVSHDGSVIYGSAYDGSEIIFKMNSDGSDYTVLLPLNATTGTWMSNAMALSNDNSKLFVMTGSDGANSAGTILRINTDGSGYTVWDLHDGWDAAWTDFGGLVVSNDGRKLYGTSFDSGSTYNGMIFEIGTDGNNFTAIKEYPTWDGIDGCEPFGPLAMSADGSKLYGVTYNGGAYGDGTLFEISLPSTYEYTEIATSPQAAELGLSDNDIDLLTQLYYDGENALAGGWAEPSTIWVAGREWRYFPDQISGRVAGDSWYNPQFGTYWFYFGSGVQSLPAGGGGQVPEPSTLLLLLLPLLGFGIRRFRKKM